MFQRNPSASTRRSPQVVLSLSNSLSVRIKLRILKSEMRPGCSWFDRKLIKFSTDRFFNWSNFQLIKFSTNPIFQLIKFSTDRFFNWSHFQLIKLSTNRIPNERPLSFELPQNYLYPVKWVSSFLSELSAAIQ